MYSCNIFMYDAAPGVGKDFLKPKKAAKYSSQIFDKKMYTVNVNVYHAGPA